MIDEARSSEIWRAGTQATRDGLPAVPERLCNSSVEQFALALTEDYKRVQAISPYLDPHDGVRTLAEEEAKFKVNIDRFEARLAEIDPHALSAHESFWADKIFTMRCEVDEDFANNASR